jgi:hypothetical protein
MDVGVHEVTIHFQEQEIMTIQPRYLVGAVAGLALGALLLFGGPWSALAQGSGPNASNALLTCEPSQQVVVRHVVVNRELQLTMQCVSAPGAGAVRYQDEFAAPVYRATQPVSAVRTVRAQAPVARTATRTVEPKRSWQKTALVIGGSAGAGAGIGAIAGGKKGALIGAAIGGGAASIFEAIKR